MASPQSAEPAATALVAYLRAGFSVIPVGDDKRPSELLPGRSWGAYQRTRATGAEWLRWWNQGARALAIICGLVSGGLYGCDCDEAAFCQWLAQSGDGQRLLSQTWVVRTCCGRLHIYLKSKVPIFSQVLKVGNLKLADIRGNGQGQAGPGYLVAPPTFGKCSHNPAGGTYTTISGSPENVLLVNDALAVFRYLADAFGRSIALYVPPTNGHISHGEFQGPVRPAVPSGPDIPPPLGAEAKAALERKVRTTSGLSRKIQRALLQGCVHGVGDWKDVDNNSDVDFALACALLRVGFTEDEIRDCFTTLHAGDFTFKNPGRPQHGMRYLLDYTLPAARKAVQDAEAAAKVARGINFEVIGHHYTPFDEVPTYLVTLKTTTGREIKVKLKDSDFESDRSFCRAVWGRSKPQFMPVLQGAHTGANGFRIFMGLLGELGTVDDDLPEGASESGYLMTVIRNMLKSGGVQHGTDDPLANSMGWVQGEWVIVRSEILISRVKGVMGRVGVPTIYQAFQKLGGQSETLKIAGRMESVWLLPVKQVGFDE